MEAHHAAKHKMVKCQNGEVTMVIWRTFSNYVIPGVGPVCGAKSIVDVDIRQLPEKGSNVRCFGVFIMVNNIDNNILNVFH